jgi:hypothetical protein
MGTEGQGLERFHAILDFVTCSQHAKYQQGTESKMKYRNITLRLIGLSAFWFVIQFAFAEPVFAQ